VYVEPAPVALDYPYTVLPSASRDEAAAAQAMLVTLAGDSYRDSLARQGLRAADGSTGAGFADLKGAPVKASPAGPAPDPATVDKLLVNWNTLTAPGMVGAPGNRIPAALSTRSTVDLGGWLAARHSASRSRSAR
jgi:Ca-activated chloride channel family protein